MDVEIADDKIIAWFKEFAEEDERREKLMKEKKVRPEFNFLKNKYLCRYILHCPKFKELYNDDSDYALKILWEIKDFKRKLCKSGLAAVDTYTTCKNCNGYCGIKACERR